MGPRPGTAILIHRARSALIFSAPIARSRTSGRELQAEPISESIVLSLTASSSGIGTVQKVQCLQGALWSEESERALRSIFMGRVRCRAGVVPGSCRMVAGLDGLQIKN